MNFIFSWQKTIFYSLAALVRKILFAHSKIKFISSRHRVISSINLSLFVEKSHRSSFDPESKLWKLALLIGVFYWKTWSHLYSITYISVIEKRTKNWLSDSSEVQRSLPKVVFWVACQRKKGLCHVLNSCSYGNTSVESQGHRNKMFRFLSPSLSWRWVVWSGKKRNEHMKGSASEGRATKYESLVTRSFRS